ncbi:MAG: OmpH family outer membrane protein [Planctomycetaceae bacterium]
MKIQIGILAAIVAVACVPPVAFGQAAASSSPPNAVAVIDVGYIFKKHARFKSMMDQMKDEVLAAENQLKAERDRVNGLVEQLKGYNVGSAEYKKLEAEIAKAQGDFNVSAQLSKKDFMDKEAKAYAQVYGEIERAVAQFAKQHGIAVVHRFDGEAIDSSDRSQILRGITKSIVYLNPGIDITVDVLTMLNASAAGAGVASQPAATPSRAR